MTFPLTELANLTRRCEYKKLAFIKVSDTDPYKGNFPPSQLGQMLVEGGPGHLILLLIDTNST